MPDEMLLVLLDSGFTSVVRPEATVGAFTIHRALNGNEWTVTHTKSGKKVWTTGHVTGAVRVAHHLDAEKLIPDSASAAEDWRGKLTEPERSRLIEILQDIAPRIVP